MKLVFTGIQGCGKGTQARLLVEDYGFTLLEMGQEFRNIIASGTELGEKLKKVLDSGAQVDEKLGKEVMESVIKYQTAEKIIFDGFIRNTWNKDVFDSLLPEYKVVFFNFSEEKATQRLLGRMYDSETGETFPAGTIINPKNGNTLIKRKDDNESAIKKRIEEYSVKTLPIVEEQRKEGKIIEINADQTPEEVHQEIIQKLNLS